MSSAAAQRFARLVPVAALAASGALAASAGACGGATATPPAAAPPRVIASSAVDGGAGASSDALPSLDTLAARGPTDAPLMREAMRVEQAAPRSPEVRAERDACLRATFAASRTVRAWFADASGAPRGEATTASSGTVPPRGPVCAKKGEPIHLVVEDAAPIAPSAPSASAPTAPQPPAVRAVIFAAP